MDAVAFQLDYAGGDCVVERVCLLLGGYGGHRSGRRLGKKRYGLEQLPDPRRETIESYADELLERSGNRRRLGWAQGRATLQEEAGDLERVEGVPAGGVVHLAKRRAGQRFAET